MKHRRIRFCWECGRKLRGCYGVDARLKTDGFFRTLHKQCYRIRERDFTDVRDLVRDPSKELVL